MCIYMCVYTYRYGYGYGYVYEQVNVYGYVYDYMLIICMCMCMCVDRDMCCHTRERLSARTRLTVHVSGQFVYAFDCYRSPGGN